MPLPNRVDPFGQLHAVSARGSFTGNRGVLHGAESRKPTGRRWTTHAWIICACAYKGRRRDVWGRNGRNGGAGWSELFFRDEATALAAGHRPCFTCRRDAARHFLACHHEASNTSGSVTELDRRLHAERRLSATAPAIALQLYGLPDGTMFEHAGEPYLWARGSSWRWSFDGYRREDSEISCAHAITPSSTIEVLRAGYRPQIALED